MSRPSSLRHQVLYVEDHPVNAILMSALFERRPHLELVVATTGAEARCLIAGLKPVLLLLDLQLPDCHGKDLLPRLRVHAPDAPAVAVTANDDFDITGTGFCQLWSKPMNLHQVLVWLDALTPSAYMANPANPTANTVRFAAADAAALRNRPPDGLAGMASGMH